MRRKLIALAVRIATALALAGAAGGMVACKRSLVPVAPLKATVADLESLHSDVRVAGEPVRGIARLVVNDVVASDGEGRARLRLDDGTTAVIDRATRLTITPKGMAIEEGRVFVRGAPGAHAQVSVGGATVLLTTSSCGIEKRGNGAKVYVASDQVTVQRGAEERSVRSGESVTIEADKLVVAPERAFDDWTGGMAVPWGVDGAPRRAVGELWGRTEKAGQAGSPLTIRSHDVSAIITGEVARTTVSTSYFNGGSGTVRGDFRMAIPRAAIVSQFAWSTGSDAPTEGRIVLADRQAFVLRPSQPVLEWAGEGWLRGTLPSIAPGATATIQIEYVEWLNPRRRAQKDEVVLPYRYPLVSDAEPPLIGEFSARIDARPANPRTIGAGLDATVRQNVVEMRRSDFRPTADLVVDVAVKAFPAPARLYFAPGEGGEDGTVLARTEVPEAPSDQGVALAMVVDTSLSVEAPLLDAATAVVEATLHGLGARDQIVVFSADQTVRPVGPAEFGVVTQDRRKAIMDAMSHLRPGGATDLGRALETAADALPKDRPAAMVVYVGDGWPTVGDGRLADIQARLARRQAGAQRLAAVAVGPLANRTLLAALVRGTGPLLEVASRADAASVAVDLLAGALRPTLAGVEVDLGSEVDRIYPRAARALVAGDTVTTVGRLRGAIPHEVTLRWIDGAGKHEAVRPVVRGELKDDKAQAGLKDLRRRWAQARVEDLLLTGQGREPATDVALRTGLLTPWTALSTTSGESVYQASPLEARILDLSSNLGAIFATPSELTGALASVPVETLAAPIDSQAEFTKAAEAEAMRVLERATVPLFRTCLASLGAVETKSGNISMRLSVDKTGRPKTAQVTGVSAQLARCVQVQLQAIAFPGAGIEITVEAKVPELPPVDTRRASRCSELSTLPMPMRRGVWRERLTEIAPDEVYMAAKRECELRSWSDARALLELVLAVEHAGIRRIEIAKKLEWAGEREAADLLRREAVRRSASMSELAAVRLALLGQEHYPLGTFQKKYRALGDDEARLALVRQFLAIAPHDSLLRRQLILLLERRGQRAELLSELARIRSDLFADAASLADGAAALRRIGEELEARRTFGELTERAPRDPWARAFLGDRLRNEGLFDDASAVYDALEQLLPDDPAVGIRAALAHQGAGRGDLAHRMLLRVAQTGGRAGEGGYAKLAQRLMHLVVGEARARKDLTEAEAARLDRQAVQLPLAAPVVVVRAPAGAVPLGVAWTGTAATAAIEHTAELQATGIGVYSLDWADASSTGELHLSRPAALVPAAPTHVRVDAILPQGPSQPARLVSTTADLPIDGSAVVLVWEHAAWRTR